jgi:hypothetical protein
MNNGLLEVFYPHTYEWLLEDFCPWMNNALPWVNQQLHCYHGKNQCCSGFRFCRYHKVLGINFLYVKIRVGFLILLKSNFWYQCDINSLLAENW